MFKDETKAMINPFDCPKIEIFDIWKRTRKQLVIEIGPQLLELSESQLIQIYNEWTGSLHMRLQSGNQKSQMGCLLVISLLHYFRRSYDELKNFYPTIRNLSASSNHDVVKAAGEVLRWAAEEYSDNQTFLRESLNQVKSWMDLDGNNSLYFNSFEILRHVGRFMPTHVLNITVNRFPEIWDSLSSKDKDLRRVATKVIQLHFRSTPPQLGKSFAESILIDLITIIEHSSVAYLLGYIMISRTIYELFPSTVKVNHIVRILISCLLNSQFDVVKHSVGFIILMLKNPGLRFDNSHSSNIFTAICSQLLKHTTDLLMFPLLNQLIRAIPSEFIPFEIISSSIGFIVSNENQVFQHNAAFESLCELIRVGPKSFDYRNAFNTSLPSVGLIRSLKMVPSYIPSFKQSLKDWFHSGISSSSSSNMILVALEIIISIGPSILDTDKDLLQIVSQFMNHTNEDIRLSTAKALQVFKSIESGSMLFKMASYDHSSQVRILAISCLSVRDLHNHIELTPQFLADRSIQVREKAIPLVAMAAESNPFFVVPSIISFINSYIATNVTMQRPDKCSKACSILPLISEHFIRFAPSLIPNLAWFCVTLLIQRDPFPSFDPKSIEKIKESRIDFEQKDLSKAIHLDLTASATANLVFRSGVKASDVNLQRLYDIENSKWCEQRDEFLFKTLGLLADGLTPYILQVIPVFLRVFNTPHSNKLYLSAIESLTKLIISFRSRINICDIFPGLIPSLLSLISNDINGDISVPILKLIGTIGGMTKDLKMVTPGIWPLEKYYSIRSESFYMRYIFDLLVDLFKTPPPSILHAVVNLVSIDYQQSLHVLDQILSAFITTIKTTDTPDSLFFQLDVIVFYCGSHIVPHLGIIMPTIEQKLENQACLTLCGTLSYKLKSEFTDSASSIYSKALKLMDTKNSRLLKTLLKFTVFAILFQHQCIDLFLEAIELRISHSTFGDKYLSLIFNSLSQIIQYKSVSIESARIAQVCFRMRPADISPEFAELIMNLCLFGGVSIWSIRHYITVTKEISNQLQSVEELLLVKKPSIEDVSFVKNRLPRVKPKEFQIPAPTTPPIRDSILKEIPQPIYNNTPKWIEDISILVVNNSPLPAIRGCLPVIGQSKNFRSSLFPIAFLTVWKSSSLEDQHEFTNKVRKILLNFDELDSSILNLINVLDCAGCPMNIDDIILSNSTSSTALSRFFLTRAHRKNPNDKQVIRKLIDLNIRMELLDSARGLIIKSGPLIVKSEEGLWNERLGNWEIALNFYSRGTPNDIQSLIQCYGNLEQWSYIRSQTDYFESLSNDFKTRIALWFAWAFYRSQDLSKAEKFIPYLDMNSRDSFFFRILFCIASEKVSEAKEWIHKGFDFLATNRNIFCGIDPIETKKLLLFSNQLIELEETLQIKQFRTGFIPLIWNNRKRLLSEKSDTWTKIFEIRSLVFSPRESVESSLKMISVLRKEQKWYVLDSKIKSLHSMNQNPMFIIEKMKILWARGKQSESIKYLQHFGQSLSFRSYEELYEHISKHDFNENESPIQFLSHFLNSINNKNMASTQIYELYQNYLTQNNIDDVFKSKIFRILATWKFSVSKQGDNLNEALKLYKHSIDLNPNDYRSWSGWAYANSLALTEKTKDFSFVINAITGFLNATRLRSTDSLEFLCQMFSMFFRYGEYVEFSTSLIQDIDQLPPKAILMVIPQIVANISHHDLKISNIVRKIIETFSIDHFEALVFPLTVISQKNDGKKGSIASDLLYQIGSKHIRTYADASLFIKGMHDSSETLCENWISTIEKKWLPNIRKDDKMVLSSIKKYTTCLRSDMCEHDRLFMQASEDTVKSFVGEVNRYVASGRADPQILYEAVSSLLFQFEEHMKQITSLQLQNIASDLSKKKNFSLSIPGTYSISQVSPQIQYINPSMQVLHTLMNPRKIEIFDNFGGSWYFLLKGKQDLRLDQRIMQFFQLINTMIKSHPSSKEYSVTVSHYEITPISPKSGLISWVTGADTIHHLVTDFRRKRHIKTPPEQEAVASFALDNYSLLNSIQRLETYQYVCQHTESSELRDVLWYRSSSPQEWIDRVHVYTVSSALMSMAGYLIGLGDRHPGNIMIQRHTGKVIHIDFDQCFESSFSASSPHPERVPFRLTRMITKALDSESVEGIFQKACENIIRLLRERQSPVKAQLEIFIYEPILFSRRWMMGDEIKHRILNRVQQKLSGMDPTENDDDTEPLTIEKQVDTLIKIAEDPANFTRQYIGWCPFW